MSIAYPTSEADILRRAINPAAPGLSIESLSQVDFAPDDHQQMSELASKARAGTLSAEERSLLHYYEVVGDLLGILRSKARISLKQSGSNPD